MQKYFVFVIAAFIAYGCASTKKVADVSIGTWDYVVKDVPNSGDVKGNFVIAKEGENYTGSLNGEQGSTPLENITIEDGKLKCIFDYQGYEIQMAGSFEDTAFTGNVSVDYNEFPMTATKRE
jgi:hypothetical protein